MVDRHVNLEFPGFLCQALDEPILTLNLKPLEIQDVASTKEVDYLQHVYSYILYANQALIMDLAIYTLDSMMNKIF